MRAFFQRQSYIAITVALLIAALSSATSAAPLKIYKKDGVDQTWGDLYRNYFDLNFFDEGKSVAFIVGISEYRNWDNLRTTNDVVRVRDFLLEEAGFDVVYELTERHATPQRVRELMSDFFPRFLDRNDRFLFYWSGHGHTVEDRSGGLTGYLPTSKASKNEISKMISMNNIRDWDRFLTAKQVLYLIDSCFSGYAGASPKSDPFVDMTIEQLSQSSRHLITAGTRGEEAIVADRFGGSVFTAAVLDGIRGAADTASESYDRDGIVSLSELIHFVQKRVREMSAEVRWDRPLTPQLIDFDLNRGEFFFLTKSFKSSRLERLGLRVGERLVDGHPVVLGEFSSTNNLFAIDATIRDAQVVLKELGFDPGPTNGVLGIRTRGALRKFQRSAGLDANGDLTASTKKQLEIAWSTGENEMLDSALEPDIAKLRAISPELVGLKGSNDDGLGEDSDFAGFRSHNGRLAAGSDVSEFNSTTVPFAALRRSPLDDPQFPAIGGETKGLAAAVDDKRAVIPPRKPSSRPNQLSLNDYDCVARPAVSIDVRRAGLSILRVQDPCLKNTVAELSYSGIRLAVELDESGNGSIAVPGFEPNAPALLSFASGSRMDFDIPFKGMARVSRVAVAWQDNVDISISALEFGAQPLSVDHIYLDNQKSFADVRRTGGGFSLSYRSISGVGQDVEVYTHYRGGAGESGVVSLSLLPQISDSGAHQQECEQKSVQILVIQSAGGRLERPNLKRFLIDGCTKSSDHEKYDSVVEDIIIQNL